MLILDLDETLVHSSFKPGVVAPDITLKVYIINNSYQIELNNKIHNIFVNKRPRAEEFIENMSKHFEIVIFTASLSQVS